MPKKPTQPFGHIAFSKSGSVAKDMRQFSDVKEMQELQAATTFVTAFNELNLGHEISNLQPLEQNDHDFSAQLAGSPLQLQLTELVDRSYTFDMTSEEYDTGQFTEAVQTQYGGRPRRIDIQLRDEALWNVVAKKLAKSYARPTGNALWLVVFSTNALYLTEYVKAGVPTASNALQFARANLAASDTGPFSEIWFTNLQTRPVRVWPTSL
jgi:hypothetical protein